MLGNLMYVMNCIRLDVSYTVSMLSHFTSNPNELHWKAIIRVLGYLKHTQNFDLHYEKYPAVLEGYCDVNWITSSNDTRSTGGYVFW